MEVTLRLRGLILLAALALTGCGAPTDADTPAAPVAQVRTARATPEAIASTIDAYGTVDYAPDRQRIVDATAPVIVETVNVVSGQRVRAGDTLLQVRPTADAVLERERAEAEAAGALRELARVERLLPQHLATNADRDAARQALATAQAALHAARVRSPSSGSRLIRADRDAVVMSVEATRGEIIEADMPMVHLADPVALSVRVGIEPNDLPRVAPGQAVDVRSLDVASPVVRGVVEDVIRQLDPTTRLAALTVRVPVPVVLVPGSPVRASILVARTTALTVPRPAVLHDGDATYVFVVVAAKARRRAVATGADAGGRVAILRGLAAGDVVVTDGAAVVEDGMPVQVASNAEAAR